MMVYFSYKGQPKNRICKKADTINLTEKVCGVKEYQYSWPQDLMTKLKS